MFISIIISIFSNLKILFLKLNEVSRYFTEFVLRNITYFSNYIFLIRSKIYGRKKGVGLDLFFLTNLFSLLALKQRY